MTGLTICAGVGGRTIIQVYVRIRLQGTNTSVTRYREQ
jgi:hypothetical protein